MRDALQAHGIESVDLRSGKSGQFDVLFDGKLMYSRYETGGFPSDAEVGQWLRQH